MSETKLHLSRPPLSFLVNPGELRTKKPWEIDISKLLEIFIQYLARSDRKDLRLCATAALSSALIYRVKVETFFIFEKLRAARPTPDLGDPPEIIALPFRYELYSTEFAELLDVLRSVIEDAISTKEPEIPKLQQVEPTVNIDDYFVRIQEMLEPFRLRIIETLRNAGETLFSKITLGLSNLDAARTFVLLLFLAMEGRIILEQQGDDIRIANTASNTEWVAGTG